MKPVDSTTMRKFECLGGLRGRCSLRKAVHVLRHVMQVDVYTSAGKPVTSLSSEFQTAISSRCVFHPSGSSLAAATASGRILIYR